jgi:hypothetical protein
MNRNLFDRNQRLYIPHDHWICKWGNKNFDHLYCSIARNEKERIDGEFNTGDLVCYDRNFNLVWRYISPNGIAIHYMTFRDKEIECALLSGGRTWLDYDGNFLRFEDGR